MVVTGFLIPHGDPHSVQLSKVKRSASVLLLTILMNIVYQVIFAHMIIDRFIFEVIGVLLCLHILRIDTPQAEEPEEQVKDVEEVDRVYGAVDKVLSVLVFIITAVTSEFKKIEPLAVFSLTIIEHILKRITHNSRYDFYVKWLKIAVIITTILPYCLIESVQLKQIVFVASLLITAFTVSITKLHQAPGNALEFRTSAIKNPETFWKLLKSYPNLVLLFDKFWPFLIPIPLVLGIWSLAYFKSEIQPQYLGILAVFASCLIMVHIHWIVGRTIACKISQLLIVSLIFSILIFEDCSMQRLWKILILFPFLGYVWYIDSVYMIIREKNAESDKPLTEMKMVYVPANAKIYFDVIERIWTATSPFLSALAISIITYKTMYTKMRLILLSLSAFTGILISTKITKFWALVEIYIIIEQTYLVFLSQTSLPVNLSPKEYSAFLANILILIIAECQRLSSIPSIFAADKMNENANKIQNKSEDSEDKLESEEEIIKDSVSEAEKIDHEQYWIWRAIGSIEQVTNVLSILALMAVLLFYPQILDEISYQTCVYSVWAGIFTFLFFRQNVKKRTRYLFMGVLPVASGFFFIYNFYMANFIIPDDKTWNVYALHASVFWLSCGALLTTKTNYSNEEEESTNSALSTKSSETSDSLSTPEATLKAIEESPTMIASKLAHEAGSILERLFVLHWTRICALLAFMAASYNPSIFGVIHLLIGCTLAWKNSLSARYYIPMILWLLCATFLPAILYEFFPEYKIKVLIIVGELKSFYGTVCLTLWALMLFLQPVFMKCLMKLTTEKEREDALVSFQILPQENSQSALSVKNYESFENSLRYYLSNWFLEFHNEIMIAILVVAMVSRKNVYGIIYAFLTLLHVFAMYLKSKKSLVIVARISFTVQLLCFLADYCLTIIYKNKIFDLAKWCDLKFLALPWDSDNFILKYILGGAYVLLTVRWYMTSLYYQYLDEPTRRFDTHWCRLCNKVSFKSMHAYSRLKHNIHLYLGWFVHIFVFATAISANSTPSIPAILLLIFSLIFFFYGEASILMPNLRNQIYIVLAIIIGWTTLDSLASVIGAVFGSVKNGFLTSETVLRVFYYSGMSNILKYAKHGAKDPEMIFDSESSRACLGITVFLILLQTRLCRSKAWPFVMARIYNSYATSTKKAKIFTRNLQAAIVFQQKHLDKASEHVKNQISSAKGMDISDWKKLCYVPPKDPNDENPPPTGSGEIPVYGTSATAEVEPMDNTAGDSDTSIRQRLNSAHLQIQSSGNPENDHLDYINTSKSDITDLHLNYMENSEESLVPSVETSQSAIKNLENNFYWYTWISFLKHIVKFILECSQEYRRLLNRPSRKSSVRIIFDHQNKFYRFQFTMQLLFDFLNANFDFVLNILVGEAQIVHTSGFSLLMVIGVLLIGQMQRPFTSKTLHNRLLVLCAIWIIFNFCKVIYSKEKEFPLMSSGVFEQNENSLVNAATSKLAQSKELSTALSIFHRIFGTHISGQIKDVIFNPTIILAALAYKRNIMRYLGLWDYGKGIEMARIYYQTEEDLDEIDEINVTDAEDAAENSGFSDFEESDAGGDHNSEIFSLENLENPSSPESELDDNFMKPDESGKPFASQWSHIFWPSIQMPWRDFYVPMFLSDFICLFLIMYYWGDFTLGNLSKQPNSSLKSSSFFNDMINQNMIPAPLVNVVLISTFVLVIDRALYVSKNYLGKVILQIITIVGYHLYLFIHLPKFHVDKDISGVFGIKVWYFFKWIYWVSSALQLKYNYPPLRTETFLGTQYGIVGGNMHAAYRAFPFLDEIKTIIDWSVTPSALGIWPWLKFSDIFERLYAVQCARAFQGTYYGRHQFGVPFNQFSKIMQGIFFITLSVLILWSPFVILSRSSMVTPNTVKSFKLEIGIENYGPPFLVLSQSQVETLQKPTEKYENFLCKADGVNPFEVDPTYFTRVQLPEVSESQWNVSEVARKRIIEYVNDPNSQVKLQFKWSITRERSQMVPTIDGSSVAELNEKAKRKFSKLMSLEKGSSESFFESFDMEDMLPNLVKAPLTEISTKLSSFPGSVQLIRVCPPTRPSRGNGRWKTLKKFVNTKGAVQFIKFHSLPESDCQFYLRKYNVKTKESGPINMYIYSSKLPKFSFSSFNLIGLYATVVFTVAQLFKMMHADMTTRIQYDDLPNPLPLLVMCQQMLMMRELGDFESEEAIYWQLIEILRNPQVLIEITKK